MKTEKIGIGGHPETLWVHLGKAHICLVYLGGHPELSGIQNGATNNKPAPEPTQATHHPRPARNQSETHTRNARRTNTTKPPQQRHVCPTADKHNPYPAPNKPKLNTRGQNHPHQAPKPRPQQILFVSDLFLTDRFTMQNTSKTIRPWSS